MWRISIHLRSFPSRIKRWCLSKSQSCSETLDAWSPQKENTRNLISVIMSRVSRTAKRTAAPAPPRQQQLCKHLQDGAIPAVFPLLFLHRLKASHNTPLTCTTVSPPLSPSLVGPTFLTLSFTLSITLTQATPEPPDIDFISLKVSQRL